MIRTSGRQRLASLPALFCLAILFIFTLSSCGGGGSTSTPPPSTNNNPSPALTSLSPTTGQAGGAAFTITVNGSGFVSGSTVYWNGSARTTTYVSSNQLQAAITQTDISSGGAFPVTVQTPSPGGGTSGAIDFTVNNPTPAVVSTSPSSISVNDIGTALTVTGTGFVRSSVIVWNGATRTTTYVSSTQLQTTVQASDVATTGAIQIAVRNGAPGGGDAIPISVMVQNPAPTVASMSPASAAVGTNGLTLTVNGLGFVPASEVRWNGTSRPTAFVNSGKLTAAIQASDLASAATAQVTVFTPAPGGGNSNALTFAVSDIPTPVLSGVNPASVYMNASDTTIQVNGTGFLYGAKVQFNGEDLATSYQYSTRLYALIPASLLASVSTNKITVTNPGIGAKSSNEVSFQVLPNPAPTLSSISPAAGPVGDSPITISLYGTNFVPSSVVRFNGEDLPTTYTGYQMPSGYPSYDLKATIPGSKLRTFGNAEITVFNPAPGGGTSEAKPFSTYLALPNTDVVYNPQNGLLYASIPSSAGAKLGNSVVSIDPYTGLMGDPIWVGSEPGKLGLSDDGSTLWVVLTGSESVRKVDLTTNTATQVQVSLGSGGYYSSISDIDVMPGNPNTIAVVYGNTVTIIDNGVARPKTGSASQVAFGTSTTKLYGLGGYGGYSIFTLDSTGIIGAQNITTTASGNDLRYDQGRLYLTTGAVLNADSGTLLGTMAANGPVAPDSGVGRAFILNSGAQYSSSYDRITAFDISTLVPLGSMSVSGVSTDSYPFTAKLIRWGQDGFAIRTASQVYLLRSSLVRDLSGSATDLAVSSSAPASAITGSNVTVTVSVKNNGPNRATNVSLVEALPTIAATVSATPSQGTCAGTAVVRCNLGALNSGASATISFVLTATDAGTATASATASATEPDTDPQNSVASSSIAITGATYNLQPVLSSVTPSAVEAGSGTFTLNVKGSGFSAGSVVQLNGTALPTTFVSGGELTATVNSSYVNSLGWSPITIVTPAPGGGSSSMLPLTVYKTVALDTNDLVFDPFTRKLWASVPSTATQATGNSLVEIDPTAVTLSTPVNIGSEPTRMSLSDDGQYLYAVLKGSNEVRRMDVPTKTAGARFTTLDYWNSPYAADDVAVMPGYPNTVATGAYSDAIQIYDVSGATATKRANIGTIYAGYKLGWTDSTHLFAYDQSLYRYSVTSSGATRIDASSLAGFSGNFVPDNGLLYSEGGAVVDPSPVSPALPKLVGTYGASGPVAVDAGSKRVFFFSGSNTSSSSLPFGLAIFDRDKFSQLGSLPLPGLPNNNLYNSSVGDLVRWGTDGLAFRIVDNNSYPQKAGGGKIVVLRGPIVIPQVATANTTPGSISVTPNTVAATSGNTYITVTGTGFVPGAVVLWNGKEKTTTFVSSTTLKVAIPASDLANKGDVPVTVANPNSSPSAAVNFTIN